MSGLATRDEIMAQAARTPAASQATSIEQSRAVAEVQAAVVIAQNRPRDVSEVTRRVKESCQTKELAEVAFFKIPRGKQTLVGESIHLAIELARCFGNISYGIKELDRDDARKMSEMLAYAWDMETNTRAEMTFLVPHVRDTKSGAKPLVDMRDIYENNANNGARRLRECIFRLIPPFIKETAKSTCYETLKDGGSKPLPERIAEAVEAFRRVGVTAERLEAKLGPKSQWTDMDIAQLLVSYRSIERREVTADEEFPRTGTMSKDEALKAMGGDKPADTITAESPNAEEGKPDEERGENVDQRLAFVERLHDEIATCADLTALSALTAKHLNVIDMLPDDLREEVNTALSDRTTLLKGVNK